jgi:uncharacterized protein involved in exopolysaccharide biosynthesis
MRTETDPRPRSAPRVTPLEAEQEVDFARHTRTVFARWWLVLACAVVGALLGWLFSAAQTSDVNRAEATVYLGDPTTAFGNSAVQTVSTNPAAIRQVARSDEVVQDVASAVGIDPDKLRGAISTSAIAGTTRSGQQTTQLYEISVRGAFAKAEVAEAANLIAAEVVERTSVYVTAKIQSFEERLEALERELASNERRIQELEAAASQNRGLTPIERLVLVSLIGSAEDRRFDLVDERTDTELLLTQARQIESGQVIAEARAAEVTPRSSRSSLVVGGLVGLIVGIGLALAWEPLLRRRRLRMS